MPLDRPDAHELLLALGRWARDDEARHDGFQGRIAASLMAMLARESARVATSGLTAREAAVQAERERLAGLLGRDDARDVLHEELCVAIRTGRLDESSPALMQHLRESVAARLAIDNPGYFLRD